MPGSIERQTQLEIALRRLELCSYAIQEVHAELEAPEDPDSKADLLISAENVAFEVIDLVNTVRGYVWGTEESETPEDD